MLCLQPRLANRRRKRTYRVTLSIIVNKEYGQLWVPPFVVGCRDDNAVFQSDCVTLEGTSAGLLAWFALVVDLETEELWVVSLGFPGAGNCSCGCLRLSWLQHRGTGQSDHSVEPNVNPHDYRSFREMFLRDSNE
jgi:hypothetical protein